MRSCVGRWLRAWPCRRLLVELLPAPAPRWGPHLTACGARPYTHLAVTRLVNQNFTTGPRRTTPNHTMPSIHPPPRAPPRPARYALGLGPGRRGDFVLGRRAERGPRHQEHPLLRLRGAGHGLPLPGRRVHRGRLRRRPAGPQRAARLPRSGEQRAQPRHGLGVHDCTCRPHRLDAWCRSVLATCL